VETAKKATAQTSLVVLVAGLFATIACTTVSSMVPVWMQVASEIRDLSGTYFFTLYLATFIRGSWNPLNAAQS